MFHPKGPTLWELLRQALSSTQRGYDLLAPKFDYTPFRTPDAILEPALRLIQEQGPVESALDLCCGTGAALEKLRPLSRKMAVGLDFSPGMLAQARRLSENSSAGAKILLVRADALEIPFRKSFDVAVCFGALGHILKRDQPRFLQQVAQALKPGGRFILVSAPHPPPTHPGYWAARIFNALMAVRNALIRPSFVMYYLQFLLPEAKSLLESAGFEVEVREKVFAGKLQSLCLLVATRVRK